MPKLILQTFSATKRQYYPIVSYHDANSIQVSSVIHCDPLILPCVTMIMMINNLLNTCTDYQGHFRTLTTTNRSGHKVNILLMLWTVRWLTFNTRSK